MPRRRSPSRVELRTLEVRPNGTLAGRTLVMRWPSVRLLLAQRRGELTSEEMWQEVIDAVESHDLGRPIERLPAREVEAIGNAWLDALKAAALPPARGSS